MSMTKKEQQEMDELREFKEANSGGHGKISKPNAGYLNLGEKPRVSVILNSDQTQALVSEEVDGHVGLTISFKLAKDGKTYYTTTPFINTFGGAKQYGVNLPSMHNLLQDNINFSAGNFAELLEGANG